MQRLRLTFGRNEELKYISHLDMVRLWERALRRARLPVARSSGFNPRPKIVIAAPLAVGITSQGEVMEVLLESRMPPHEFFQRLSSQLPRGVDLYQVEEVAIDSPSLPSRVQAAEYRVGIHTSPPALARRIEELLAAGALPRQRQREKETRSYDLRPLILDLQLEAGVPPSGDSDSGCWLRMRLRADPIATGRPDEVLAALGLEECPHAIHRTRLIFAQ